MEINRLCEWLSAVPINRGTMDDCLRWEIDLSGQFLVASVWKWMQVDKGPKLHVTTELWPDVAPPKILLFGWLA